MRKSGGLHGKENDPPIGRAELEVLKFIAERHPITVREVAAHAAKTTGHARTTILTVMRRLHDKGHLLREKIDGVFHYSPSVPKEDLLQRLIGEFVDRALGGSLAPFLQYLTRRGSLSESQIAELKSVIRKLEKPKQKGES